METTISSKRPERKDKTASKRSAPKQTTEMVEIAGQSACRDRLVLGRPMTESNALVTACASKADVQQTQEVSYTHHLFELPQTTLFPAAI